MILSDAITINIIGKLVHGLLDKKTSFKRRLKSRERTFENQSKVSRQTQESISCVNSNENLLFTINAEAEL